MKRIVFILSIVLSASIGFVVEAKSTMELLINKDWHELNVTTMRAVKDCYIRFTGTQRMIVSGDSVGNTKAQIQRYYLSNKKEEIFDSTKVGKKKKGNYIIIQGDRNSIDRNVFCFEIKDIGDNVMDVIDINHPDNQKHLYYSDPHISFKPGDVISTLDLLMNKIWFQVDPITGERLNVEHQYGRKGVSLICLLSENRRTQIPQWLVREYYLSDTIVTKFNHKQMGKRINGRYLVVNELDSDGNWQTATYDIATLSENRLELECVYPKGNATQVFVSKLYSLNAEHAKRKPQQAELMKDDWYRLDTTTFKRSRYIERYNKTHVTRIVPIYSDGDTIELKKIYEYYMSNQPEMEFDWSKKGKTSEGDYIVVNEQDLTGKWNAVNYRVELLSGGNLVTVKEVPGDTIIQAFERDLSEEDKFKLAYQQKQQAKADTTKKKTMMDMLVGKQWKLVIRKNDILYGDLAANYFTEEKYVSLQIRRTYTKERYLIEKMIFSYKLVNEFISRHSKDTFIHKKDENGLFVDIGFGVPGTDWEILYLSDYVFITRVFHMKTEKILHTNVYICE